MHWILLFTMTRKCTGYCCYSMSRERKQEFHFICFRYWARALSALSCSLVEHLYVRPVWVVISIWVKTSQYGTTSVSSLNGQWNELFLDGPAGAMNFISAVLSISFLVWTQPTYHLLLYTTVQYPLILSSDNTSISVNSFLIELSLSLENSLTRSKMRTNSKCWTQGWCQGPGRTGA